MPNETKITFPCPQCGDVRDLPLDLDADPVTKQGERYALTSTASKEMSCGDCGAPIEVTVKVQGLL